MNRIKTIKIGELAKKAGVTTRTIRYYEEINIIKPSGYSKNGFRLYSDSSLQRLNLIKVLKELKYSLEEIQKIFLKLESFETGSELSNFIIPLLNERRDYISNQREQHLNLKNEVVKSIKK